MKVLYYNAKIYQNDEYSPPAYALLVESGLIQAIFNKHDTVPHDALAIDLNGDFIYPGFIDTHTHSYEGGLYANGIDLMDCRTIAEVLESLSAGIRARNTGDDSSYYAWRLDETKLRENRFPTLAEVDAICPRANLLIRRIDGHSCLANSHARKQIADLKDYSPEVLRAGANDRAVYWFHRNTDDETILAAYHTAARIALKGGFTGIHTMIGDAQMDITHYSLLRQHLRDYPIEYTIYPQTFNIEAALKAGAERIGGCILADGSIGSHTAAVSKPYLDAPDARGELYHPDDFWKDFINKAHQHGLQVAVHCIGDRAIRQINDIYLHLAQTVPKDLRHQLIHCELTPIDLIRQIKQSGAVPVMQPAFDKYWGGESGFYATKLGVERAQMMNRFSSMFKAGITITGGSDWYVTELDALQGIFAAIHHQTCSERLSITEAIDIYSKNAAWLSHSENKTGQIKPGFQADFTILNQQLDYDADPGKYQISKVIKRGEIVYSL